MVSIAPADEVAQLGARMSYRVIIKLILLITAEDYASVFNAKQKKVGDDYPFYIQILAEQALGLRHGLIMTSLEIVRCNYSSMPQF